MVKQKFWIILVLLMVTAVGTVAAELVYPQAKDSAPTPLYPQPNLSSAIGVGGLAWVEPKSRVIKLGVPNVIEGARVEELYVGEGEDVQKGQVIGVFSTYSKNKAALDVSEANLALAKAELARVKAGNKQSDIASQRQTVQSIRASETAAVREYKRIEELYKQQLVSKSQYDVVVAEMESAVARRKSAEESLSSLELVRPDDVAISEGKVRMAESEVAVAKANLELSTITAPFSGTILTIHARNSESVGDYGVLDIADLNVIDAVMEVDENDILKIVKGQKAEIRITEIGNAIQGTVREIGSQVKHNGLLDSSDPSRMLDTRVLEVRIELDKSQNDLIRRLINKKARAVIFTSAQNTAR